MIIKLKQAMGRILRSKYDYGCFIVFDMGRKENFYRLKKDLHECEIICANEYNLSKIIKNHLTSSRKEIIKNLISDISKNEIINDINENKKIEEFVNDEISKRSINAQIKYKDDGSYILKYFDLKYKINKRIMVGR